MVEGYLAVDDINTYRLVNGEQIQFFIAQGSLYIPSEGIVIDEREKIRYITDNMERNAYVNHLQEFRKVNIENRLVWEIGLAFTELKEKERKLSGKILKLLRGLEEQLQEKV